MRLSRGTESDRRVGFLVLIKKWWLKMFLFWLLDDGFAGCRFV